MTANSHRRVELDGLRAVAVLLVVAGHALRRFDVPNGNSAFDAWVAILGNANLGVRIFFVLSGFLITSLLLAEKESTGSISFLRFYQRRCRRILPALVAYLLAIALLAAADVVTIDVRQFAAAATFTWNYLNTWTDSMPAGGTWYLGHLWTLSLEEQFYLVWPIVVAWFTIRGQLKLAIGVAVLWPVFRIFSYAAFPASRGYLNMYFHTGVDSIVWGSLYAVLMRQYPERMVSIVSKPAIRWSVIGVLFVLGPLFALRWGGRWSLPLGFTVDAALSGLLILSVMHYGPLKRALSWTPLVSLGMASYSIYLWQQLFLAPSWVGGWQMPTLFAVLFAISCGFISSRVIEKPFLGKSIRTYASAV